MTPEAMAALHAQCFPDRPWSAAEFAGLLDSRHTLLLESPRGDGFILARAVPPEAEILTLAVAPAARRQGIGAGLVSALLSALAARGVTELFLEVADDNLAARALYRSFGFRETGRRRDYYARSDGGRSDAVLMARAVAATPTA